MTKRLTLFAVDVTTLLLGATVALLVHFGLDAAYSFVCVVLFAGTLAFLIGFWQREDTRLRRERDWQLRRYQQEYDRLTRWLEWYHEERLRAECEKEDDQDW